MMKQRKSVTPAGAPAGRGPGPHRARPRKRLTPTEFEAAVTLLPRVSQERVRAARLALVDARPQQEIADMFNWSRQAVGDCVQRVWSAFELFQNSQSVAAASNTLLPDGWQSLTLVAPAEFIEDVRNQHRRYIASLGPNAPTPSQAPTKSPAPRKVSSRRAAKAHGET